MAEEDPERNNIALFVFLVLLAGLLDGIVGELHEELVLTGDGRVVLLVDLGAGPYIGFGVDVGLAVGGVEEHPGADVEFPVEVEEGAFDEFLNDEGVVAVLQDLIALLVLLLDLHLAVVVVVHLEDRDLVPAAPPNAVVDRHDVSQLVEILKNMDANSSVETCGLQQPEVLASMAAGGEFERSLEILLLGGLDGVELLVDGVEV